MDLILCAKVSFLVMLSLALAYGAPASRKSKSLASYMDLASNLIDLETATPTAPKSPFQSPVYYIRLPPQPYVFVQGLGYVSQPPAPVSPFVNLPISFVSNGKPAGVYRWAAGLGQLPPEPTKAPPDSPIQHIPGQFVFNGKPSDVFVLRDSYNSIYGDDPLGGFYP